MKKWGKNKKETTRQNSTINNVHELVAIEQLLLKVKLKTKKLIKLKTQTKAKGDLNSLSSFLGETKHEKNTANL